MLTLFVVHASLFVDHIRDHKSSLPCRLLVLYGPHVALMSDNCWSQSVRFLRSVRFYNHNEAHCES
jgi:hypothetical protein